MASRWRHWDAGCHDSLQTVSKYQSLQHSSEGLSDGHFSSDEETKQMLCRVGVGRGRGRSKAEVLGKAPGRETDNGFTFSGSSGDFRAYTKQSALKQLPSHNVKRNDNTRERESKTKTQSSSQTSGLLATKRLWTPDPKKRWKKDKIAHPDNVEEWPDLSSDSKGSPSRGKKSPRKRKGKGDVSPPGPGVSPDVRSSPKTDDQKTLEKQHGRQSKDGGKEEEVLKPAPDLSLEAV
uniref:Uncharacterized protein n=1 Tax=Branchiostoma floridae TaxID=7739 RepID=C3Z7K2_BRAFL|eukprot:XP_002595468.1 hypothetical protein BRAFLDRAFT_69158 [Branchiostoma floridae]